MAAEGDREEVTNKKSSYTSKTQRVGGEHQRMSVPFDFGGGAPPTPSYCRQEPTPPHVRRPGERDREKEIEMGTWGGHAPRVRRLRLQ